MLHLHISSKKVFF